MVLWAERTNKLEGETPGGRAPATSTSLIGGGHKSFLWETFGEMQTRYAPAGAVGGGLPVRL